MKQIIMASPINFSIHYDINPWMAGNYGQTDKNKAIRQWSELRNALSAAGVDVIVMPHPPEYCPDAVFTANAGVIYKEEFLVSRFRFEERAVEEPYFSNWFQDQGFSVTQISSQHPRELFSFEGAGDALFSIDRKSLWLGCGFRTTLNFKNILDVHFTNTDIIVRGLELVNPNFYHLDTCFCPLDTGELIWYPPAFSEHSQMVIDSWYSGKDFKVSKEDALAFACNAVSVGTEIIMPNISESLLNSLTSKGYKVTQIDMSEFLKSGGACKCLTIEIIE